MKRSIVLFRVAAAAAIAATVGSGVACGSGDSVGSTGSSSGGAGSGSGANTGAASGGGAGSSGGASISGSGGGSSGGGGDSASAGSVAGLSGGSGGIAVAGSSSGGTSGGGGSNTSGTGGSGSSSGSTSGSTAGSSGGTSGGGTGGPVACPFDSTLPAQPALPTPANICKTLTATQAVAANGVPAETLDTGAISSALSSCGSGKAVKLAANGANNAFVTGPLSLPSGVTLWIDAGVTLFGSRDPGKWGGSSPLISVSGSGSALVGDGVIDGQGGEPPVGGGQSPWEQSIAASPGSATLPPLIETSASSSKFTMYRVTLHNAPKFHVKLSGSGHVVWGATLLTPSKATNSVGTALTPHNARNTDGIDPGEVGSVSNVYILYSTISVGDDMIAIKGGSRASNITVGHSHFGSGHGMSIGSQTNGGVDNVNVCDLTIDNSLRPTGSPSVDVNGLRIKSDPSRGGPVKNINYSEICIRDVDNPIIFSPFYMGKTAGGSVPTYTGITVKNVYATSSSVPQVVTIQGFDSKSADLTGATLDNVVVNGPSSVVAQDAIVTLGPGAVSFAAAVTGPGVTVHNTVAGASAPIDCSKRWVPIP